MAARAYWQGQIRLALVSIPVQVFPATKTAARIAFNHIHKPSGKRIRYEKVVPGIGAVAPEDIVKGYEVEKGKYVLLTEEEINDVKLEAKRTIDLVQFVDENEIDQVYFDKPYYVSPEDDETSGEAYVVLRDALKATKKIGIGHIVARGQPDHLGERPHVHLRNQGAERVGVFQRGVFRRGRQADDVARLILNRDAQPPLDVVPDRLPRADGEFDHPGIFHTHQGGEPGQVHRHFYQSVDKGHQIAGKEHQFVGLDVEGEVIDQGIVGQL
jgi:hypothetical protein